MNGREDLDELSWPFEDRVLKDALGISIGSGGC